MILSHRGDKILVNRFIRLFMIFCFSVFVFLEQVFSIYKKVGESSCFNARGIYFD